jgi:thymidylate synthase (FAD)
LIRPFFLKEGLPAYEAWSDACAIIEDRYLLMLKRGCSAQEARSVLPNSLKTEIVMTCNLREWMHVFKLRTAPTAHPQMRQLMIPLAAAFAEVMPELFQQFVTEP